ncbi:bifunctional Metallo-beta-lactamase/Ribonuclease Z-Hydroxyacylglutathione hydrolase-like [Babesia duncani]|uniref:Bifunctional Metallo-beta-lactamase/Ribonuclease Z-Hydroxyacylglutathione hydrolase-like n=1 Tax=Babesia duncani TaxID=323732 RepID=A0AAD9PLX4_9APIC|nr:bifunctional Metallo-beta-lactamase/Ribonuclease Z-Hydroxyacylglutathione hydrolase-like [Babesia duncani]
MRNVKKRTVPFLWISCFVLYGIYNVEPIALYNKNWVHKRVGFIANLKQPPCGITFQGLTHEKAKRGFKRYAEQSSQVKEASVLFDTLSNTEVLDELDSNDAIQDTPDPLESETIIEVEVEDKGKKTFSDIHNKLKGSINKLPSTFAVMKDLVAFLDTMEQQGNEKAKSIAYTSIKKKLITELNKNVEELKSDLPKTKKRLYISPFLKNTVDPFFEDQYVNPVDFKNYFSLYDNYKQEYRKIAYLCMKTYIARLILGLKRKLKHGIVSTFLWPFAKWAKDNNVRYKEPKPSQLENFERLLKYYGHEFENVYFEQNIAMVRPPQPKARPPNKWSLIFLGTGSRQPTDTRMTSTMAFTEHDGGRIWLFDCGEGTCACMQKLNLNPKAVDRIFITHLHGDHCFGLFSFISNSARALPITVYGPIGISKMLIDIMNFTTTSVLPKFVVHELVLHPDNEKHKTGWHVNYPSFGGYIYPQEAGHYLVYENDTCKVMAAPLKHILPTVGYVIKEKSKNENDSTKTQRKIVICQDSCDSSKMVPISMNPNVLIHEATTSTTSTIGSSLIMQLVYNFSKGKIDESLLSKINDIISQEELRRSCFSVTFTTMAMKLRRKCYLIERSYSNLTKTLEQNELKATETESNNADMMTDIYNIVQLVHAASKIKSCIAEAKKIESQLKELYDAPKHLGPRSTWLKSVYNHVRDVIENNGNTETSSSPTIQAMESLKNLLTKFWTTNKSMGLLFSLEINLPEAAPKDWFSLYSKSVRYSGHSTPWDAGKFAAKINAASLYLTHLSSKYRGDWKLVNEISCARLEDEARLAFYNNERQTADRPCIKITTAYDGYEIHI